tara:strand:- start:134 stop:538 length:405 start_codon:yes stop_codon:yes gene_type:complete
MAIVLNKTRHALGILSREFSKVLGPDSSAEIPDDVIRAWCSKPEPRALVDLGGVEIRFSGAIEEEEDDVVELPFGSDYNLTAISSAPFREAIDIVAETADLDLLIALHASETRKKVLSAIEVRMEELRLDGIDR